jgi:hypothetical protein
MEGANWRVILDGLRDGDQESWVEFDGHFRRQMLSAMARKFPKLQSSESARDVVSTALQQIVHQIRLRTRIFRPFNGRSHPAKGSNLLFAQSDETIASI